MTAAEARLCFVGPLVGRHAGNATMQAEKLADLFARSGHPVRSFSSQRNPYLRLLDTVLQLIRHGRRVDVTLLEIYGGRSFVIEDVASWLARRLGHRLIMTLHGGALPEFTARYPRWSRRVLRRADLVVAPSGYLARMARTQGLPVTIIPNVIDPSVYPFRLRSHAEPRLWWMRSFHEIYNPRMALRVLARLRDRGHDATLTMCGPDKGLEPSIRSEAQAMGLADHVRFAGFLDAEGKAREGGAADIFLNTSRIDNMPVALVEAAALGLPVVSTDVGGIPDIFTNGVDALLTPTNDEAAMAEAVERVLREPELAARLSRNGRALAMQSAWEQVRPRWEQVIRLGTAA